MFVGVLGATPFPIHFRARRLGTLRVPRLHGDAVAVAPTIVGGNGVAVLRARPVGLGQPEGCPYGRGSRPWPSGRLARGFSGSAFLCADRFPRLHVSSMSHPSQYQRLEARKPKKPFDPESLSKAQLVRIVTRAVENPEDFPLWLRREISAREGTGYLDREMRAQIEGVFGDLDYETHASGLIASMREAVRSGAATPDQGVSWALDALDTAEETITHQMDDDFEIQSALDDLSELAVEFLNQSNQGGEELAECIAALLHREFTTPTIDLKEFAKRLGKEGLVHLRSALERQSYPDRKLLAQIYEMQKDVGAWIELKLASPSEEEQIAGLEEIKTSQSPQKAIERARALLEAHEKVRSDRLRVRQWWYQERSAIGENPSGMAADAREVFERQPCSLDAWKLLEEWSRRAGTWESVRTRALEHLRQKETGKHFDNFRLTRIRVARDEGRERDAWEIARLGLASREMEEAIFLAFPHWPAEALVEFDILLDGFLKSLEGTNSQNAYQAFADLLRRGKKPFGADWLGSWKEKVEARFARRPKLLQMVGKV